VNATYATGAPQPCVPATLTVADPDAPTAIELTISTFLKGTAVLVKIDRAG
jgi:hypothetical protein